jgi:hypothetical protein
MPIGSDAILVAIERAARAGKLRLFVRQNGTEGLAGLLRLADAESAASAQALSRLAVTATPR